MYDLYNPHTFLSSCYSLCYKILSLPFRPIEITGLNEGMRQGVGEVGKVNGGNKRGCIIYIYICNTLNNKKEEITAFKWFASWSWVFSGLLHCLMERSGEGKVCSPWC